MKIKTITCHDVNNAGASLQAYALQNYLTMKGHEVEIIDYKPIKKVSYLKDCSPKCGSNFLLKTLYNILKFRQKLNINKKTRLYKEFKEKYLITTKKSYYSNDELKEDTPGADVYIAGSDQIWNTYIRNGIDEAFFLDFAPDDKIRASYAASFSIDDIPEEYKEKMSTLLKRMDYIAVREISGIDILKSMGIYNGVQVMDPVFLFDKEYWSKFSNTEETPSEKYILLYDFDGNKDIVSYAIKMAKKYNMKIYSIFKNKGCKYIKNMNPIKFVAYIRNADFIISNSFHATAFSIIFEKQFVVFNRKENINTRMRDLLSLIGFNNRLINNDNTEIDVIRYNQYKEKMMENIEKSKEYLNMIIGETK